MPSAGQGLELPGGGWRCQAPRGSWEGIFRWLKARGPGMRRLEDRVVMSSKERKSGVGEWKPEAESS